MKFKLPTVLHERELIRAYDFIYSRLNFIYSRLAVDRHIDEIIFRDWPSKAVFDLDVEKEGNKERLRPRRKPQTPGRRTSLQDSIMTDLGYRQAGRTQDRDNAI